MILMFDGVGTFNQIFRTFFGGIDKLIYSLVGWVLQGIFNLSDLTANTGLVEIIYKRIYVVLAIFMVFKLTFSFLQYMINPESMTDKERGVGKIIVRIVIMLAMIVALPILFFEPVISVNGQDKTVLTALQDGVIETLPRIILGIRVDDETIKKVAEEKGEEMAVRMLQAFYYSNECSSIDTDYANSECSKSKINNLDDFSGSLLKDSNSDDIYDYGYMWPMSTIAGIALVVILLGMAVDVAVRVFKLLILQLIAPVPVMSYIDPKSSKDGAFSSWTKNFVSTYLDIFIKLGTVYLLLLLISEMFNLFGFEDSSGIYDKYGFFNGSFILVFLIIGLFKFAKDAPKFIKEAIGIKDSGGGGLFGGLQTLGAAAGVLGGATAGLVGGVAGGVAAAKAAKAEGNKGYGLARALGGGLSGLARGGVQGGKGAAKGNLLKGMSGAIAAQNAVTQRNVTNAANGSTLWGRTKDRADQFLTGQTAASRDEERLAMLEEEKSKYDRIASTNGNLYDYIMDKATKAGSSTVVSANHKGHAINMSYDTFNTAYQNAKSRGIATFSVRDATTGNLEFFDTNSSATGKFLGDLQEASATAWAVNNSTDARLIEYERDANVTNGSYNAEGLKDTKKLNEAESRRITGETFNLKTSKGYKANKANADAIKRGK